MNKLLHALPWLVFLLAIIYAGQKMIAPDKIESPYNLNALRQLPVSADGRTKPLDTVARNALMNLSGKQSIRTQDGKMSAIEWYIELVTKPEESLKRHIFRIDHPDLLTLLGLENEKRTRFSFEEIQKSGNEITRQAMLADKVNAKSRDPFQRAVLVLNQRLTLFAQLTQLQLPYLVPPLTTSDDWRSLATTLTENPNDPDALSVLKMLKDYRDNKVDSFNEGVLQLTQRINEKRSYDARKSRYEVIFNQIQPFYNAMVLYVLAFLLGCFGLLSNQLARKEWSTALFGSMTSIILVAFIIHTLGIASRIYLQGRPPVTNLYSSAIFIGWISIMLGLFVDRQMKLGIGGIMASAIGFGTLVIAHNLGSSGDTMGMMQAVLDSNFWLSTHVVTVTMGYSATFFAGFLATAYVLLGVFTPVLDHERGKSLIKMTYGVICFATLLSFVGTVLGGIWADQSWGRFWGWDAKENGAALIVFMNLLILHARWGGMIKDRGLVNLAIFGNIITAWSWFGTNMLGVGLHSYGFTQSAVFWISLYVLSQLLLIGIGLLPTKRWRSKFARHQTLKHASPTPSTA